MIQLAPRRGRDLGDLPGRVAAAAMRAVVVFGIGGGGYAVVVVERAADRGKRRCRWRGAARRAWRARGRPGRP